MWCKDLQPPHRSIALRIHRAKSHTQQSQDILPSRDRELVRVPCLPALALTLHLPLLGLPILLPLLDLPLLDLPLSLPLRPMLMLVRMEQAWELDQVPP